MTLTQRQKEKTIAFIIKILKADEDTLGNLDDYGEIIGNENLIQITDSLINSQGKLLSISKNIKEYCEKRSHCNEYDASEEMQELSDEIMDKLHDAIAGDLKIAIEQLPTKKEEILANIRQLSTVLGEKAIKNHSYTQDVKKIKYLEGQIEWADGILKRAGENLLKSKETEKERIFLEKYIKHKMLLREDLSKMQTRKRKLEQ